MNSGVDTVELLINSNTFLLISGIIALIAFSYFVYRITVPQIQPKVKVFLVTIRAIILALLLILVFEPLLKISSSKSDPPVTLIFVDNSNSILLNDSSNSFTRLNSLVSNLGSDVNHEKRLFTFGTEPAVVEDASLPGINFIDGVTNIENVFNQVDQETGNVTGAVIISDGIINNGSTSLSSIDRLGIPLYTIGIGDTTQRKNLMVKKINRNKIVYSGKETEVEAVLVNTGLAGISSTVRFYEENELLESKSITLNESGVNRVKFKYTPQTSGEKKIRISINNLPDEYNSRDNYKTDYITILNNKLRISLVAGSPSPDLAFIKSSLSKDKNLAVTDFTQISGSKFSSDNFNRLDSTDILFLLGFPASNTPNVLIGKVVKLISEDKVPFLYMMGASTDFNRMNELRNVLSFNYTQQNRETLKVQPVIKNLTAGILKINSKLDPGIWSNLAPVSSYNAAYSSAPGGVTIASAKVGNQDTGIPIILSYSIGTQRNLSILCFDIWKWKLSPNDENDNLYDQFISNIVRWLNVDKSQKGFTVRTTKKVFTRGEPIDFTAELYDDLYQPVDNADVYITFSENGNERKIFFEPVNNGLYEGSLTLNTPGDITYTGVAVVDKIERNKFYGNLTIEDVNLESLNLQMDANFLQNIAGNSGGIYVPIEDYSEVISTINSYNQDRSRTSIVQNEYKFWTNEWILITIILLFAVEWFIRKRMGML